MSIYNFYVLFETQSLSEVAQFDNHLNTLQEIHAAIPLFIFEGNSASYGVLLD